VLVLWQHHQVVFEEAGLLTIPVRSRGWGGYGMQAVAVRRGKRRDGREGI
jgi:hypothetical protein